MVWAYLAFIALSMFGFLVFRVQRAALKVSPDEWRDLLPVWHVYLSRVPMLRYGFALVIALDGQWIAAISIIVIDFLVCVLAPIKSKAFFPLLVSGVQSRYPFPRAAMLSMLIEDACERGAGDLP